MTDVQVEEMSSSMPYRSLVASESPMIKVAAVLEDVSDE